MDVLLIEANTLKPRGKINDILFPPLFTFCLFEDMLLVLMDVYVAGSDTSGTAIDWFFYFLAVSFFCT